MNYETALYYLFSTVPQTLAATGAFGIIIIQFQLTKTHKYLVGIGESQLNRAKDSLNYGNKLSRIEKMKFTKQSNYSVLLRNGKKNFRKLRDAVSKENYTEIKEILQLLARSDSGNYEFGFKHTLTKFSQTENKINDMDYWMKWVIFSSVITVFISIAFIPIIPIIKCNMTFSITAFIGIVLSTFITLIITVVSILKALK